MKAWLFEVEPKETIFLPAELNGLSPVLLFICVLLETNKAANGFILLSGP